MSKYNFKDNLNVHKIGNTGNINKQTIIFKTFKFTLDIILHQTPTVYMLHSILFISSKLIDYKTVLFILTIKH